MKIKKIFLLVFLICFGTLSVSDNVFAYQKNQPQNTITINGVTYDTNGFADRVIQCTYSFMNKEYIEGIDGQKIYFEYDGYKRIKKINGNVITEFILDKEGRTCKELENGVEIISYTYKNDFPFSFTYNGEEFFYLINDGIIVGIIDGNKKAICKYIYDDLGLIKDIIILNYDSEEIASVNHLRYRGYFYDVETMQYFIYNGGYYNPQSGEVYGLETILDVEELLGDRFEEIYNYRMNSLNSSSNNYYSLLSTAIQHYQNSISYYTGAYTGDTWYTAFSGNRQYYLIARVIYGENSHSPSNQGSTLDASLITPLKENRQGIGWVILNRYLEEQLRRNNPSYGCQFTNDSVVSFYSILTHAGAFSSLNGQAKIAVAAQNTAYQEAFWIASCIYAGSSFEEYNLIVPRPIGVTWQCYNKGNLDISPTPSNVWKNVIFPGSSTDFTDRPNYSSFTYFSNITKFNVLYCYKSNISGGETLLIESTYY